MSVIESVMLKFISSTMRAGSRKVLTTGRSASRFDVKHHNVAGTVVSQQLNRRDALQHSANAAGAAREVYLEGYSTHEEVVRAYLAFAGIDPDSKEGRFYFDL